MKSAQRTVHILETLAESPRRLTLTELQTAMGYPRSSLHALVRTLRELKWIESDESGSAYGVGPHALLSGTAYLDRDSALLKAVRVLEELRDEVSYTTHYARLDEASVIYLATRESKVFPRFLSRVGRQLPAHTTALGQALLAELTDTEVNKLLPDPLPWLTEYTITDRDELAAELDRTRSRGYAVERQQGTVGIACVACTVAYRIPATDAVSCSIPAEYATGNEVARVSQTLRRHVDRLAHVLRREGIR